MRIADIPDHEADKAEAIAAAIEKVRERLARIASNWIGCEAITEAIRTADLTDLTGVKS